MSPFFRGGAAAAVGKEPEKNDVRERTISNTIKYEHTYAHSHKWIPSRFTIFKFYVNVPSDLFL